MSTAEGAGWLERLGAKRGGLALLIIIGVGGFSAGAGTVVFLTSHLGLPKDVEVLEAQGAAQGVTIEAQLEAIATNTAATVGLTDDVRVIRAQVSELYCDRWPARCVAAPGESAPGGGP